MIAWSGGPHKAVSAALSVGEGGGTPIPISWSAGGALFGEQSLSRAGISISIIVKRATFDLVGAVALEAHGDTIVNASLKTILQRLLQKNILMNSKINKFLISF